MAILMMDSFERYAGNADLNKAGWSSTYFDINTSTYRTGSRAMHSYDRNRYATYLSDWNVQTACFTYAIYCNNQSTAFTSSYFQFSFRDPTNNWVCTFFFMTDGSIRVYRGRNSVLLGQTVGAIIVPNQWISLSFKVYVHDTNGTVDIYKNGVNVLSLNGVDTKYSSTYSTISGFVIGSFNDNIHGYYDDMYVTDGDVFGDLEIPKLSPNGIGTNSDFEPHPGESSSVDNWENANDSPPDDATYNFSDTPNDKDSYAMENLVSTGQTIHAIKNSVVAEKNDAGTRIGQVLTLLSGSEYLGDQFGIPYGDYEYFEKIYNFDPGESSSAAFDESDINGMEVGMKLVA